MKRAGQRRCRGRIFDLPTREAVWRADQTGSAAHWSRVINFRLVTIADAGSTGDSARGARRVYAIFTGARNTQSLDRPATRVTKGWRSLRGFQPAVGKDQSSSRPLASHPARLISNSFRWDAPRRRFAMSKDPGPNESVASTTTK